MFNSLWIDKEGALPRITDLKRVETTSQLANQFETFWTKGYCIIPDAVPHAAIDMYLQQYDAALRDGKLKASFVLDITPACNIDLRRPPAKILDTYIFCDNSREVVFSAPIKAFLETLFEGPALAFQGLHFEVGSTQAVHQDTSYVVVDEPKSLAAVWIALEDISPGTGELVYYPGSHRFDDYLYPNNRKNWSLEDGSEVHHRHLIWIHEEAKRQNIPLERFLPKKGDALFWHADLAHGGSSITEPNCTRKSLVIHYCPVRCSPHYLQFLDQERQKKRPTQNGGYYTTMYY